MATRLRPALSHGKPAVTDVPCAEAKDLVGGFFIINAADRDEAVRVASLHPAATLGESVGWGIEVHPIGFFEQAPGK
ncbi:MAG: YciI family protein [Polaromonas sp.]|uniref:YciI family protein n=1 Tax=Polaromonas sp. TaxID=1869339 RepID=UPI002489F934|nr:YciI family protein [Polaromonas sp.]MDI1268691.1 YciI family protein [Polaromonas sp.]